jgi:uncharacterized protein (DUF433 family)
MNLPDFITCDADGYIRLTGHRIGLQDVVYYFNQGFSPEMLLDTFPTLSLPLIYKTIGFYLENQEEVDAYIQECEAEMERQRAVAKKGPDIHELRRRREARARAEGA